MAEHYSFFNSASPNADDQNGLLSGVIHHRPCFAHVEFTLTDGQTVLADGGALIWKDANMNMETQLGDCLPACWRKCAGESCCQNKFTGPGKAAFSFKLPGDMLVFMVNADVGWKLSAGAFVCGSENCEVTTTFTGCFAWCCGGEEAWLTKCVSKDSNEAVFYAGGYGAITKHEVPEGHTLSMSTGTFFATPEDVNFTLRLPGGCFGYWCGGEGIVMAINGPTSVFTQNRNPAIWKTILRREGASKKNSSNGAAH